MWLSADGTQIPAMMQALQSYPALIISNTHPVATASKAHSKRRCPESRKLS
jgi:hypothetical protein